MRSLFWKIFLWFWGAVLLIGAALYLVVLTTPPEPMPRPWRETAGRLLASYAQQSAHRFERSGKNSVHEYFRELEAETHGHFWLFTANGNEVSGRPIPPRVPNKALLPPPPHHAEGPPRKSGPIENLPLLRALVARAAAKNETVFEWKPPRILAGQRVESEGENYVLVASLVRPEFRRTIADPRRQMLGVLALLVLSTLVCLLLTRSLTAPILALRQATQRLAGGELSTRSAPQIKKRRDEIADLAYDFDTMAARMEVLLNSQRRLLGDVSHELRSPLARLSMALGLARRHAQSGNGAELEDALNRIAREKERLNELIGQLLELVRLESGESEEPRETIDLQELVRDVAEDADFEARASNRRVLIAHSEAGSIQGSHELLRRAVENVVRNAVAYTAAETAVEISLHVQDEYSSIRVRDHGSGVPEEALDKLFQPFYRVAESRDRQSGGVGLGLAITERAVRSHGGSIAATNADGGGLQIEIRLPISPDDNA